MFNKKFILIFMVLLLLSTTFVSAGLLTWFKGLFGVTGKVVVNVNNQKDYCPEVSALEARVKNFEDKARIVIKNAGSCLDDTDCNNGQHCLDNDGDKFYLCE